jgi:hypothetical protein
MATVEKDFKVKNGLLVTAGGSFGGAVAVATPTEATHAATKAYVDSKSMSSGTTPPASPTNGQLWLDTLTQRVNVFYANSWLTLATIDDTLNLPQHIHDTSINGTGLIVSTFTEGGSFNSPQSTPVDGGGPADTVWTTVLDGGSVVDNFN